MSVILSATITYAADVRIAPECLREQGIQSYAFRSIASNRVELDLLDQSSAVLFTLNLAVHPEVSEVHMEIVPTAQRPIEVVWSPAKGALAISSEDDVVVLTFHSDARAWTHSGSSALLRKAGETVRLAAAVLSDLFDRGLLVNQTTNQCGLADSMKSPEIDHRSIRGFLISWAMRRAADATTALTSFRRCHAGRHIFVFRSRFQSEEVLARRTSRKWKQVAA
ncbi:MAG TPA: hypothetical protein VM557_14750 [Thermoanaerobaculia bacterium]|nr:hypothetical protein [Thermoanaerobaculia bacterium]